MGKINELNRCLNNKIFIMINIFFIIVLTPIFAEGENVNDLIEMLYNENPNIREKAVVSLAKHKDKKLVNHLISLVDKETEIERLCLTLGYFCSTPGTPSISSRIVLQAINNLKYINDKKSFQCFLNCLKFPDWRVRVVSAEALGLTEDPQAVKPLIEALFREYSISQAPGNVTFAIDNALWQIGEPSVNDLVNLLNHIDPRIRLSGAYSLMMCLKHKKTDPHNVIIPLIKCYDKEISLFERNNVLLEFLESAISEAGDVGIIPLLESMKSSDAKTMYESLLQDLKPTPPQILSMMNEDTYFRHLLIEYLVKYKEPIIEDLINSQDNKNIYIRIGVADTLGRIGENRIDKLLEQSGLNISLKSEEFIKEYHKTIKVCFKDDTINRIRKSLLIILSDENEKVQWASVKALGSMSDQTVVEELIAQLSNKDKFVRGSAASYLFRMFDKRSLIPFISSLNDENETVRKYAVMSIGFIGNKSSIKVLKNCLEDPDESVRQTAKEAIDRIYNNCN